MIKLSCGDVTTHCPQETCIRNERYIRKDLRTWNTCTTCKWTHLTCLNIEQQQKNKKTCLLIWDLVVSNYLFATKRRKIISRWHGQVNTCEAILKCVIYMLYWINYFYCFCSFKQRINKVIGMNFRIEISACLFNFLAPELKHRSSFSLWL